jgi:hypothetical protein
MIVSTRVSGTGSYGKALRRHLAELEKDVQSVIKQEARALAISYGLATVPFGQSTGAKYRKKIEADVGKVLATREDPMSVYRMLKKHAPTLAGAYWHAYKTRKPSRMAHILRKANLPQGGASRAAVKPFRTRADGAVGRIEEPATLVRKNERNKVVRESQATVGTAKAGWHQAGKALGGRTRRNLVSDTGKRSTVEAFPAYVRKVSRKFTGLGGAYVGRNRVRIWTNVRHSRKALRPRLQKAAEGFARDNVAKAMAYATAARNEKWNRSA